jgi:hypothetical protein
VTPLSDLFGQLAHTLRLLSLRLVALLEQHTHHSLNVVDSYAYAQWCEGITGRGRGGVCTWRLESASASVLEASFAWRVGVSHDHTHTLPVSYTLRAHSASS